MASMFLAWLPLLIGVLQVPMSMAICRPLWPYLRKRAPMLLCMHGTPYFVTAIVLLIVVPGMAVVEGLSHYVGVLPRVLANRWGSGLSSGLVASIWYYAPIDIKRRPLKWRIGSNVKEHK